MNSHNLPFCSQMMVLNDDHKKNYDDHSNILEVLWSQFFNIFCLPWLEYKFLPLSYKVKEPLAYNICPYNLMVNPFVTSTSKYWPITL